MATTLQAFDGDTLEDALARVTEQCGPGARITQAEKVRSGGLAGFFARERFEVTVEVDDDPEAAPAAPAPAGPDPVEPPRPLSLLDLVDQASDEERRTPVPAPSTEGPTFQEVLRGIASEAGLLEPKAQGVACEPVDERQAGGDAALFTSLGIPEDLLRSPDVSTSVARRLLGVLERIPQAPPVIAQRGEIVAVVGERSGALEAAALLARQLGQCADDVVVAGPDVGGFNTLCDPSDAADRAARWRSCGSPFVVAICVPAGSSGATWAREMRDALSPAVTWTAVRADRKPEDITMWVEALGGADALAVTGCDDTATPAAVLATGIPVASIEGRRASAAAWTALLFERLAV